MSLRPRSGMRSVRRASSLLALVALVVSMASFATPSFAQGTPLDPPDISCSGTLYSDAVVLQICGGGWGGAPAGFVVDFQTEADFNANGWNSSNPSFVSVTFTGATYDLAMGQCINVQFGKNHFMGAGEQATDTSGAPLACNTTYVFRTKALASSNMTESAWSGTLRCTTAYECNVPAPVVGGGMMNTPLDPPDMYCPTAPFSDALVLHVCGGGWGGAPAGFEIQYQTAADFATYGWPASGSTTGSPSFCSVTFVGGQWNLGAHVCVDIQFGKNTFNQQGVTSTCTDGAPLACNTTYVFRSLAFATDTMTESPWSGTLACSTDYNCNNPGPGTGGGSGGETGCTYTQGYWKNHPGAWPVTSLTLGTVTYTQAQLLSILKQPVRGNGLVQLAHQLIAAKLNIAAGASDTDVASAIASADAMIGGLVIPPVGSGTLKTSVTSSLNDTLTSFNEGEIGPGHCD